MSYRESLVKHMAKKALAHRGRMSPQTCLNRALNVGLHNLQHGAEEHIRQLYIETARHEAAIEHIQQYLMPQSTGNGMQIPSPVRKTH